MVGLLGALGTARDLGRLHEIGVVLARHGMGDAVRRLGIAGILERAGRAVHLRGTQGLGREPQVRLREALETLGPTFVKLGQVLAGRSDLLPPAWVEELSRLHERARPVPFDDLRRQLEEDLGRPPREVFAHLDPEPLAAASIAQVHRATLVDGSQVVLKIRRPGIEETVRADLGLLARLAEQAEERMPELRRFRPRSLVRGFARALRSELDLRLEARNTDRIRANLRPQDRLVVPALHHGFTTERLCVQDHLEGPSLGAWLRGGHGNGQDPAELAARGAQTILRMILVDGCYHADPHPGNLLVLADGRLGLLDFGLVGHLSDTRRGELLDLVHAVHTRDVDAMVEILGGWSSGDGPLDLDLCTQDCAAFLDRYQGLALRQLSATEVLSDLTALLRDNDLALPGDVALLIKVFLTLDGLGRSLDPGFVMASHIEPYALEAWRERRSPRALARRGARSLGSLLSALPRDLERLAARARHGRLRVDVDMTRLSDFAQTLDRSASRLTVGLVTAALIVGTSIALTVSGGPTAWGLPVFGLLGFSSSLVAGVWLLGSILRSSRS